MPIPKISRTKTAASNSTHGGNGGDVDFQDSTQDLMNHMDPNEMLVDPEDDTSGSTHTSITASKKQVKAAETTNVSTMDVEEDPTAGYLETAEIEEDDDGDFGDFGGEETASDTTLLNNNDSQELMATEGEDEDWDPEPTEDGDENDEDEDEDIEDDTQDEGGDEVEASEEVVEEAPEDQPLSDDAISLLDVDEVPDDATDNVNFAVAGTRLMVIKAHRIIATMTAKKATAMGRHDVYLSDQFQQVTASEMQSKGLRKGLKSMGFTLATVTLAKATVVKTQVAKELHKATAAVRKVQASKDEAFEQSLAIAAVGLNRKFFNDCANPLKDNLQAELQRAGVRNPGRILQRAFAEHGPDYAKSIVELAKKISAMPQDSRDGMCNALDMTSSDLEEPEDDVVQIGADDDGDEFEDEDEFVTDSVESTLATAGVRSTRKPVTAAKLTLAAMTGTGDEPLFSL